MKYEKGKLGLIIPSRSKEELDIISLEELQEWRSQLPVSDIKASIKSCYDILKSMHDSRIDPKERLAMLEIVQPTVTFLCESLIHLYKQSLTFRKKFLELYRIILSLHLDLFTEYKLTLEDLNRNFADSNDLIEVISPALEIGRKIVYYSAETYRNPPAYIWLEIHTLYHIARNKRINNKDPKDLTKWQNRLNSISNLYKHILLFSLTNPLRYHRSDLIKIYYTLEAWAPLLKLDLENKFTNCLFKADLGKDASPHYNALDKSEAKIPCYLELDPIIEHIESLVEYREFPKNFKQNNFTTHELSLSLSILQILLHTWQHCSQRQHVRKKTNGTVTLGVGLRAIYQLAYEFNGISQNASIKDIDIGIEDEIEEINLDSMPLPEDVKDKTFETAHPIECSIVDKSDGGFCFKCKGGSFSLLQAGEIVGIIEHDDTKKETVQMAIIRWVQFTDFDYALIGVELISRDVMAGSIKAQDEQSVNTSTVDGLLMRSVLSADTHMLVTPTLRFNVNSEVTIEHAKQNYQCLLLDNLGLSPCYAIWEVEFLSQAPKALFETETKDKGQNLSH